MESELLESILAELKKTNNMLQKFLTNAGEATEDAVHSYIATIDQKVDRIANNLDKIANK